MSSKALITLAFFVVGLLTVVIIGGLIQKTLDGTGVAVALSTVLTGIIAGVTLRERDRGKGGDEK